MLTWKTESGFSLEGVSSGHGKDISGSGWTIHASQAVYPPNATSDPHLAGDYQNSPHGFPNAPGVVFCHRELP